MICVVSFEGVESERDVYLCARRLGEVAGIVEVRALDTNGVYEVESRQLLSPDQIEPLFHKSGYAMRSIT